VTDSQDYLALSVVDFAEATAAKAPTPGGGSVAGAVGSLGVALGEMTLNFSKGKKKLAEHEDYYTRLGHRLEKARAMFQALVADDVAAYTLYQAASRLEDGPEKDEQMDVATAAAINVPREVTKLALAVMEDMKELAGKCNTWLITDLMASATLCAATVRLSDYNVRINLPSVRDADQATQLRQASADDLAKADILREEIEAIGNQYL
jgi:formiminotetrahydrofolate cyclodeaminase